MNTLLIIIGVLVVGYLALIFLAAILEETGRI